jgi:hypothetical protein
MSGMRFCERVQKGLNVSGDERPQHVIFVRLLLGVRVR